MSLRHSGGQAPASAPHHPSLRMTRSQGMMTAQQLTGAPLISLVPSKSRKLRRAAPSFTHAQCVSLEHKLSEPLMSGPGDRQRHGSEVRSSYYQGQHLYQKRSVRRAQSSGLYLQDFYKNPGFGETEGQFRSLEGYGGPDLQSRHEKLSSSKSFDNLSDTISVTSDEYDNFKPRIIKPRRRRKKEKSRRGVEGAMSGDIRCQETSEPPGSEVSLGSGQQHWLPRGLLSAESESNGDSARSDPESGSETGDSDKERRAHRKLGVTLSVPTYTSYASSEHSSSSSVGSDYYSQASPGSRSSVASETGSEDTCNGHVKQGADTCGGHVKGGTKSHSPLSATKSFTYPDIETTTSCSYFRSPKLNTKMMGDTKVPRTPERSRLRKTNSWAYPVSGSSQFSLFSPGTGTDLLSGIRKHLSKIDLHETEAEADTLAG